MTDRKPNPTRNKRIFVKSADGQKTKLPGLIWGNNAAWICECRKLNGDVTADGEGSDRIIKCPCGQQYEIVRGLNRKGRWNRGPAKDIRLLRKQKGG